MILETINQCFGDYLTHLRRCHPMSPLIPSPTAPPGAWAPRWGSWRATGHGPGLGLGDDLVESTCPIYHMGVFKNRGTPKSSILIGFSNYKPSILGYPYFRKHPYFIIFLHSSHGKWVFGDFLQQRIVGNSRQTGYSRYLIISYVFLLIIYCMLLLQFSIPYL